MYHSDGKILFPEHMQEREMHQTKFYEKILDNISYRFFNMKI